MKWLVARYPKEPGKLIALGNVLIDPEEPETCLNLGHVQDVENEKVLDESLAVKQRVEAELSSDNSALLKAMTPPVFGPGVSVNGKLSTDFKTTVEALNVKAKIFIPSKKYMDQSVENSDVQAYIKKHLFAKSLYMIVGVATANELTINEVQSREANASASAGVAPPGSQVEAAAEASHTRRDTTTMALHIKSECDFAYRIRKFRSWKLRDGVKDKGDRSGGALFGRRDDGSDESDDEDEFTAGFQAFEEEDVSASPGGLTSFEYA